MKKSDPGEPKDRSPPKFCAVSVSGNRDPGSPSTKIGVEIPESGRRERLRSHLLPLLNEIALRFQVGQFYLNNVCPGRDKEGRHSLIPLLPLQAAFAGILTDHHFGDRPGMRNADGVDKVDRNLTSPDERPVYRGVVVLYRDEDLVIDPVRDVHPGQCRIIARPGDGFIEKHSGRLLLFSPGFFHLLRHEERAGEKGGA